MFPDVLRWESFGIRSSSLFIGLRRQSPIWMVIYERRKGESEAECATIPTGEARLHHGVPSAAVMDNSRNHDA
jgi:hypothetical protein